MKTIAAVTVGRSDWGILRPVLRRLGREPEFRLHLIAAGAHLSEAFGKTLRQIEAEGFIVGDQVETVRASEDSPQGIAESIARGIAGFSHLFGRLKPDLLMLVADRFETFAAAVGACPWAIPLAHLHGGELTQGTFDDGWRHCITKLSHLHFVSTETHARRVVQLGEEPWRVVTSGAPSLDELSSFVPLNPKELQDRFGLRIDRPPLVVTFHPVTLEYEKTEWQVGQLLQALREVNLPVLFTQPNADTYGRRIERRIREFLQEVPTAQWVACLGTQGYWSVMKVALAMVGNSSSGLVEAPSFGFPVVNVGSRQQGRTRAQNVIDVGENAAEIAQGIRRAVSAEFRQGLRGIANPYGDGHACERIVEVLKKLPERQRLIQKIFFDIPADAVEHPLCG